MQVVVAESKTTQETSLTCFNVWLEIITTTVVGAELWCAILPTVLDHCAGGLHCGYCLGKVDSAQWVARERR